MTPMRFAKLEPADLFLFFDESGAFFALLATDPTQNGERYIAPFSAVLSQHRGPTLMVPKNSTVISFGKEYSLRLPSDASGWRVERPSDDVPCILITDDGRRYLRVNPVPNYLGGIDQPACYVDMKSGVINAYGSGIFQQIVQPAGIIAFAVKWEILTTEKEPRLIITQPDVSDLAR